MRGGVDSAREAADHSHSGVGELVGKFLRAVGCIVARLACSNDADRMPVALKDFAKDIEGGRWVVDLSQKRGVIGRGQGENFCAVFTDESGAVIGDLAGLVPSERASGPMPAPQPLYVVSDGVPVRRRDWYARLAARSGSPPPTWDPSAPRTRGADKRVDPSLLFHDIPITLAYPDSFRGIDAILQD